MGQIRTELVAGPLGLRAEELAEVAADGHTFASAEWFRLLEAVPLERSVGENVAAGFAITREGDRPIALLPLTRIRPHALASPWTIRQRYFESWIEELRRAHPLIQARFARLVRSVRWYRSALDACRTPLDEVLIIGNPLASRSQIAVAPSAGVPRTIIYRSIVSELERFGRRRHIPLWFMGLVGEQSRWGDALEQAGCVRSFACFENVIETEPFRRFSDYLQGLRRSTRRAIQREISVADRLGVSVEHTDDVLSESITLASLDRRTNSTLREARPRSSPEFFRLLGNHFGNKAEAFIADRHGTERGYHLVLRNERRGELFSYRLTEIPSPDPKDRFTHSPLAYYEPIRRAIALGYRRVWLGPGESHAKFLRGARPVPIYSYFWFPRRWDRWCLAPYLKQFGEVTESHQRASIDRPAPWREMLRRAAGSIRRTV